MMGRPIPEVREEMYDLADEIGGEYGDRLRGLAEDTYRNRAVSHGRTKAKKVTADIVKAVKQIRKENPGMLNREIGLQVGIDGGRVSEILTGRRNDNGDMVR